MTEEEKKKILGKTPTPPLYYKFNDYQYNDKSKERVLSKIDDLDYLTSGFELGCVTIWTGQTNAGKTTVMTMLIKQTILQGEKVFFFNGEQTKDDFKNNLYKQTVDKKDIYEVQYPNSRIFDKFVKKTELPRLERLYGENIYIYNNKMQRTIDFIVQAMDEVRIKNKVKVFILDNFMQIDTNSADEYREQKDIMEKLRTFAVNKNVHIHLVVHPRKTEKFQVRLSIYDVIGSSNLVNKAYNVISIIRVDNLDKESQEYKQLDKLMQREGYDIEKTSTILEVLKTKGLRNGLVGLEYDSERRTFKQQPIMTDLEREMVKTRIKNNGGCPF